MKATISTLSLTQSVKNSDEFEGADVVGIDEAQFFGSELNLIADYLAQKGKIVICAGLDADFNRNKFGCIIDLIPRAEKVKKLQAVCTHCGNAASFSQRHTQDETKKNEIVVIGGKEMYEAVCRDCYIGADEGTNCDINNLCER